jgi:hypothetical protein
MRLPNHTPHKVLDGTAIRVGHYSSEKMLRLALVVQPPHMAEEEQFLKDLTTKGSPAFHQFLSPEEWNARFGPSVEDEQKVVDWAQSIGLTVTQRYPNRLLVDVEAPAGVIENALGVTINNYQLGEEVDFSNDRDPAIPGSLSGIVSGILGMNSIQQIHGRMPKARMMKGPDYVPGPVINQYKSAHGDGDPVIAMAHRKAGTADIAPELAESDVTANSTTVSPFWVFSSQGYDYDGLYNFSHCCNVHNDSGGAPNVSSIALVTFGDFEDSDVQAFFSYYGFAYDYNSYTVDGDGRPGQDDEAPGDLEYSTATANSHGSYLNTAKVFVYEVNSNLYSAYADAYNNIATNNTARVVSTSYGGTEENWDEYGDATGTGAGQFHGIFNSMTGEGYTLIASAGDNGSSDGCGDAVLVDWPAADPNFIAAGGTGLTFNSDGTFNSEVAWTGDTWSNACGNNWGGGGGGVSALFPQPSWQSGLTYLEYDPVDTTYYVVSGSTGRLMPDISLSADPDDSWEAYYYGGGWSRFDGTSIVAPELAGFFAQENSYLNYIGNKCGSGTSACTPLGNPAYWLYYIGNHGAQHDPYYDTLTGCNSNNFTVNDNLLSFCATTGWDAATGWGSANMMQLAWGINWQMIPAYGVPSIAFTGPATGVWYNSNQQVNWTVTDGVSAGSDPPTGVAGFTQGWDSIPADPYSEAHGGAGNSFYAGPQFPFATSGCLAFDANGCSGNGGAQGCHTVQVEAWDNQGSTATGSYGPLCYDSVAPTIAINTSVAASLSTGWFNIATGDPYVSLVATDPGGSNASGVKTIYGVVGPTSCWTNNLSVCQIYGPPFTLPQGANPITTFSLDNAGNFSSVLYDVLWVDTVAPVTTPSYVGTWSAGGTISTSAVTVNLSATDATSGVQYTYYTLDGGSTTAYSAPFVVSTPGSHTLKFWSVDWAGNTEAKTTKTFSIVSPTTAVLVATPNPSLLGQTVTMTATITATVSGTPTGSVTFWNGATNLGTSALSGGVATISTTALPAGLLTLQASYNGATYFQTTNSPPFDQTVNEHTTTAVTISPNPVAYGQTTTLTATVSPSSSGTPTGTVAFYLNGAPIGSLPMSGGVASISTSYFGSNSPGAYTITGVYSGDSTYLTSTSAVFNETVTKATQSITFTPITGTQYAGTMVGLSASASSGLTVTLASTTPSVCSVSGTTASLLTSGTCVIHATQAGNTDYSAAPLVSQNFTVTKAPQTITFPTITATQYAATALPLSAAASSGLSVSLVSTTPTVCTLSGTTASLLMEGTCIIQATQTGNATYAAAPMVQQNIVVHLAAQTITFPAPTATQYALTEVTLTATASSGLPITYSSISPSICTVSGSTASLLAPGICYIHAAQAGNTVYSVAPLVTQSFLVHDALQTITFPAITGTQYVLSSVPLSATASSGLTVAFASATTSVCTVSGATASLIATGTCVIHATQAGSSLYASAALVAQSFVVHVNAQAITWPAITATQYAASTLPLTATASSGLTVAFASTTPAVCTVAGTTASLLTSGTCILQATQAGNADYSAAPQVQQNVVVHLAAQTITFPTIASQVAGANVTLSATANSGLAVSFTSATTSVCTVTGTTATMVTAGTCVIHATQTGNTTYSAAPLVSQSFAVKAN